MTTSQKIEKALAILNTQDWYWAMSDYTHPAYDNAFENMRVFVELVATIENSCIIKALRNLWKATYNYVHATMWSDNEKAKAEFDAIEAELMAIIKPQYVMAA